MNAISVLILFPLVASIAIFLVKNDSTRNVVVRICAIITGVLTLIVVNRYFKNGISLSFQVKI